MIVFMGTPKFAVPILEMLIEEGYPIGLVVTQPDAYVGRKRVLTYPPVKEVALKHHLPVFQPEKIKVDYERILELKPILLITAAFGQILPKELLNQVRSINIHGSLLPKYRGGAPIQYALFNGDKETGVTLMEMVYKMDAGNIIKQRTINIEETDDYETLSDKLSLLGRDLLREELPNILSDNYQSIPQDEDKVTFSPTIKFEEEALDFSKSALWNHNRVRGLSPNVGAHFYMNHTLIKVFKSSYNDIIKLHPNEITIRQKRLFIGCGEQTFEILELQQEGKKRMGIKDYLNGQNLFIDGGTVK